MRFKEKAQVVLGGERPIALYLGFNPVTYQGDVVLQTEAGYRFIPMEEPIELAGGVWSARVFLRLYSAYSFERKRINCAEFFKDPIPPLGDAILRIVPRIDMQKIRDIIEDTPYMADTRKDFLIQSITMRKELILDRALKRCSRKSLDTLVKETAATQRGLPQAPSKGFREIGPTR